MRLLLLIKPLHQSLHNTISQRWFHPSSLTKSLSVAIPAAIDLLNLSHQPDYSSRDLRDAYFTAAKACHPDSKQKKDKSEEELTDEFHRISDAYELLLKHKPSGSRNMKIMSNEEEADFSQIITKSEEQFFRESCRDILGLDAETVEESKRCPLFRDWLKGRTDGAFFWNNFLMQHGGLAPMLQRQKTLHYR